MRLPLGSKERLTLVDVDRQVDDVGRVDLREVGDIARADDAEIALDDTGGRLGDVEIAPVLGRQIGGQHIERVGLRRLGDTGRVERHGQTQVALDDVAGFLRDVDVFDLLTDHRGDVDRIGLVEFDPVECQIGAEIQLQHIGRTGIDLDVDIGGGGRHGRESGDENGSGNDGKDLVHSMFLWL